MDNTVLTSLSFLERLLNDDEMMYLLVMKYYLKRRRSERISEFQLLLDMFNQSTYFTVIIWSFTFRT